MLKLSACVEMIFGELPFYDRFKAAKDAGLDAVEFWGWKNKDLDKIVRAKDENGLKIAAFCVDSVNPEYADEFNAKRLLVRDGINAFRGALNESVAAAKKLDVQTLIVTVGQGRADMTRHEQHTNIVLALRAAAPILEDAGITLVVEPLNILCNHRGYYLDSSYEAFGIIEEVGSPMVKVLYDIYHQQISEGNIIPTITKNINFIGHFHAADVPGRHEPGTGELNYRNIFAAVDKLGYDKYVGLEYSPSVASTETIKSTLALI